MSSPAATAAPMEAQQRMHLRKSSRKVEAMLGVTPIVLQVNVPTANKPAVPRPLTTPRTRARRRRAQVCQPPASGSGSATDEDYDDDKTVVESAFNSAVTLFGVDGFVWVEETIPQSGYLPHSLRGAVSSRRPTHRGRSKSEGGSKVFYKTKSSPLPPLPISAARLEVSPKTRGSAQPVLVVRTGLSPSVPSFHRKSPSELTFTSIMGDTHAARKPISPLSPSPRTSTSFAQAQERELRRKKMAKLARTLGGNVPPELVFQNTNKIKVDRPASVTSKSEFSLTPKSSLESDGTTELAFPKKFERPNRPRRLSVPTFSSPKIPKVEIEQVIDSGSKSPSPIMFLPTSTPSISITEAPSPPAVLRRNPILAIPSSPPYAPQRTASKQTKGSGKANGSTYKPLETPKYASAKFTSHVSSKSTPHLGPFVPAAADPGSISLNSGSTVIVHHTQSKSLADYRTPADYVYGSSGAPKADGLQEGKLLVQHMRVEELHRRKEREWSGEWNVPDMGLNAVSGVYDSTVLYETD